MKPSFHILIVTSCLLTCGCLAKQVASDGRGFRDALLDMYMDQTIDNLVRAHNFTPFVQLQYHDLTVTDSVEFKENVGDELDKTSNSTVLHASGGLLSSTRSFTDKLTFGGSSELDRQMIVKADPVTAKQDIFDYYQAFAQDPSLFFVVDKDPGCRVYYKKQYGHKWYVIPEEAGGVFLQLMLQTTFMRGAATPPPILWTTTIIEATPRFGLAGQALAGPGLNTNQYVLYLSDPVPNDYEGIITVIDDRGLQMARTQFDSTPFKPGEPSLPVNLPRETPVKVLYAQSDKYVDPRSLVGRPIKVFSPRVPNVSATPPDLQRLNDAVKRFHDAQRAQGFQ